MNIQQIRSVLTVAKLLSFSEAAFMIPLSTSTVSKHVLAVEDELGIILFKRRGKSSVSLTEEGALILPHLQNVLEEFEKTEELARNLNKSRIMNLNVGCTGMVPAHVHDQLIGEFLMEYPQFNLHEAQGGDAELIEKLYHHKVDVCIATVLGNLENHPDLYRLALDEAIQTVPISYSDEFVVLNSANPLGRRESIAFLDLFKRKENEYLFIRRKPGEYSIRQKIFLDYCSEKNFVPRMQSVDVSQTINWPTVQNILVQKVAQNPNGVVFSPVKRGFPGTVELPLTNSAYAPITFAFYLNKDRSTALQKFLDFAQKFGKANI